VTFQLAAQWLSPPAKWLYRAKEGTNSIKSNQDVNCNTDKQQRQSKETNTHAREQEKKSFLFNYSIFTIYSRYLKRVISKRDG
jgi:hypothetical protein